MAKPDPIALNAADAARVRKAVEKLSEAELRVRDLRGQLDARFFHWHEDGVTIAALARATGLSRQTVYAGIARHRVQLGA